MQSVNGYEEAGRMHDRQNAHALSLKTQSQPTKRRNRRSSGAIAAGLLLALQGGLFMADASAATPTQVGSGMTAPNSGIVLNGGAINPATNLPYRHLWMPDHLSGVCRMDPDLD